MAIKSIGTYYTLQDNVKKGIKQLEGGKMIADPIAIVPNQNSSVHDLRKFIVSCGIRSERWTTDGAGPIHSLRSHLKERRTDFVHDEHPMPILEEHSAVIIPQYRGIDGLWELYEDRHVMNASRMTRNRSLTFKLNGVGTNIRRTELPVESARRCLKRELIGSSKRRELFRDRTRLHFIGKGVEIMKTKVSDKWAPIKVKLCRHLFICTIAPDAFDPEGYVEQEEDREVFYLWKKCCDT